MKRLIDRIDTRTATEKLGLECWHEIEQTNAHRVGDLIDCSQCDALDFPLGLSAYKTTPVFNQQAIPKGFRRAHSTKKGVWALIKVVSGQVHYVVDDLDELCVVLDENLEGVIAPQMMHHLDVIGDVELYVEFYTH